METAERPCLKETFFAELKPKLAWSKIYSLHPLSNFKNSSPLPGINLASDICSLFHFFLINKKKRKREIKKKGFKQGFPENKKKENFFKEAYTRMTDWNKFRWFFSFPKKLFSSLFGPFSFFRTKFQRHAFVKIYASLKSSSWSIKTFLASALWLVKRGVFPTKP